jgi:hypothetical protein
MQFSSASCHFIPLRSKYSPQHPVHKHPQSLFALNVRDRVSHPYRTAGRIIECRREDKRLWNVWWQALSKFSLLLISSWMQLFRRVTFGNLMYSVIRRNTERASFDVVHVNSNRSQMQVFEKHRKQCNLWRRSLSGISAQCRKFCCQQQLTCQVEALYSRGRNETTVCRPGPAYNGLNAINTDCTSVLWAVLVSVDCATLM